MNKIKNFDLSIVVPFYKRTKFAQSIVKSLDNQNDELNLNIEVIFIDSDTVKDLSSILNQYETKSQLEIIVVSAKNIIAEKRNVGINSSRSENIVCLDDDCIPGDNFLNAHHKALVNITNQKKIFSGKVYFPRELSENSNFHRFRNERHRAYDINYIGKKNIHFTNIVTMNLSFKKSSLVNNNLFFDTEYDTYGLEDTQFGLDAVNKGFDLEVVDAQIYHADNTTLDLFANKIKSFAFNYFFRFYEKNKYLLKNQTNDSNDPNLLHQYLIKIASVNSNIRENYPYLMNFFAVLSPVFLLPLLFFIKTFLKISDTNKLFYSYSIFKLLIIVTILISMFDKNSNKGNSLQ
tara:strand:+ start:3110 stop:4153 length:1044 start_codon:yes stop_codon:yes gene_type:complete